MTSSIYLDWAIVAASLFNMILPLWLGLTVLLNAERRVWGVWLTGGGLVAGGAFFAVHTTVLGLGPDYVSPHIEFWWAVGWLLIIAAPLAWYLAILWYVGFWDDTPSRVNRRHRWWVWIVALIAASLTSLLILGGSLPSYAQTAQLNLTTLLNVRGIPITFLVYPAFILLSIGLSLHALRNPAPSQRVMGEQARLRAKPWLVAASLALLIVSLMVTAVVGWLLFSALRRGPASAYRPAATLQIVAWFDLAISTAIAAAVMLIGQAISAYEVFTGHTLPRKGLARYWRRAIILATGYAILVGGSLVSGLRPVYILLLTTLLMVSFYALLSWRSYADRERHMRDLQPFVTSEGLYERLLSPEAPLPSASAPFRALCAELLGTRHAYLVATGPLAPLVGSGLSYPDPEMPQPSLSELVGKSLPTGALSIPVDPGRYGGAIWAVPLWGERGITGMLLLGEKLDGSLYTQEEMEIARIIGERLIDTRASGELARRLIEIQRERLAEAQIVDHRTRRVLHDDVLPSIHAALLALRRPTTEPGEPAAIQEAAGLLTEAHHQISDLLRDIVPTLKPQIEQMGVLTALRTMVENEFGHAFDKVTWQVDRGSIPLVDALSPVAAEVLFYAAREAIRNAARHARPGGQRHPQSGSGGALHLSLTVAARDGLEITIADNGVGMEPNRSQAAGHGLALHSTMMAIVGGTLTPSSRPGQGTRVTLHIPASALSQRAVHGAPSPTTAVGEEARAN